jgi:alpha-1,3-glucanase-like protein
MSLTRHRSGAGLAIVLGLTGLSACATSSSNPSSIGSGSAQSSRSGSTRGNATGNLGGSGSNSAGESGALSGSISSGSLGESGNSGAPSSGSGGSGSPAVGSGTSVGTGEDAASGSGVSANSDGSAGSEAPDTGSAPTAGATTPFVSYEAEAGNVGGGATVVSLTSPPTTEYSSAMLEASGHAYVHLSATGQYVEWVNKTGMNVTFINVRESIPDAPNGGGITATLNLYVNGELRQSLNVNSKQSWLYEGGANNSNYNGNDQNPADGDPRVFFDDVHAFIVGASVAPGDAIRLEKDAANTASFYDVDVIDIEAPPAPLTEPANALSITDYGAVANSPTTDSTSGIQKCINAAQSAGKSVWVPQGTFYLNGTTGLSATGITIEGAGMWYSTIYRNVPLPNSTPLAATFSVTSCTVRNFSEDANAISRASVDGAGGAMDTTGTDWLADSLWIQHTESGFWASGTGGTVQNSRLTSIWADGCNLNNVSLTGTQGSNLAARNNFVRGTGDDAIAINSVDYNGNQHYTPMSSVTIENNTSIAPWGGKGVAIYGGGGHVVQNNYMSDTARYIGLGVGKFGVNGSDLTSATVTGNVVVRCGGNAYVQEQPALHIGNGGDGQGVGTVENAKVSGNTVLDSLYNAIGFSTSWGIVLSNNTIASPGLNGIVISPPFYPAPMGSATITGNSVTGLGQGDSAFINMSTGFTATVTGNSWQ